MTGKGDICSAKKLNIPCLSTAGFTPAYTENSYLASIIYNQREDRYTYSHELYYTSLRKIFQSHQIRFVQKTSSLCLSFRPLIAFFSLGNGFSSMYKYILDIILGENWILVRSDLYGMIIFQSYYSKYLLGPSVVFLCSNIWIIEVYIQVVKYFRLTTSSYTLL